MAASVSKSPVVIPLALLFFLSPFIPVSFIFMDSKATDLEITKGLVAHNSNKSWGTADGPVLIHGRVTRLASSESPQPLLRQTPSTTVDANVVGWAAAKKERRGKYTQTKCSEQHVESLGITIENGPTVSVDSLFTNTMVSWNIADIGQSSDRTTIYAGHRESVASKEFLENSQTPLGLPLPCPAEDGTYFTFQILKEDDPITIVACKRGDTLVHCSQYDLDKACNHDILSIACAKSPTQMFSAPVAEHFESRAPTGMSELWVTVVFLFTFVLIALGLSTAPEKLEGRK